MIFSPILDPAFKAYNARQPRDDRGKWSDGAGGISAGHAAHVMRSEGVSDEKAAAVLGKIKDGTHKSREDVLKHIDAIHAVAALFNQHPSNEITFSGGEQSPTGKRHNVSTQPLPILNADGSPHHSQGKVTQSSATLVVKEMGKASSLYEVENHHYTGSSRDSVSAASGLRDIIATGLPLREAKRKASEHLSRVVGTYPGGRHALTTAARKSADESTMFDDTLIAFGGAIKSVEETEDSYKFGAFLVVFDSPDISNYRDSFTKSTDFGFEDGDTRPILYNHGLDGTFGKTTIGKARLYLKDAGVWMEGEVKKRKDYLEKHIERVGEGLRATVRHRGIEAPMFGASSGSAAHSVVRETKGAGHEIKQWFLAEASITPSPAEPQTVCMSLKSLIEIEAAEIEADEADEIKKYNPRQPRDDDGRWSEGGATGGFTASHAIAVMRAEGITDARKHEEVARAIAVGIHQTPEHVLRHIDRLHWEAGKGVAMNVVPGERAPEKSAAPDPAMIAALGTARDKAYAAVTAAHNIRRKIMDSRNAALNGPRRASKSDDDDFDFDADDFDDEIKASRGWQTQPRDDGGKWTDGAGNLSVSHVREVMKHEGITEAHHQNLVHAEIQAGRLKTREAVLQRIDAIHAANKAPKTAVHEMTLHDYAAHALRSEAERLASNVLPHYGLEKVDKTEKMIKAGKHVDAMYLPNGKLNEWGGLVTGWHKDAVEKALAEGKAVSPSVLADHPELSTTAPDKGASAARTPSEPPVSFKEAQKVPAGGVAASKDHHDMATVAEVLSTNNGNQARAIYNWAYRNGVTSAELREAGPILSKPNSGIMDDYFAGNTHNLDKALAKVRSDKGASSEHSEALNEAMEKGAPKLRVGTEVLINGETKPHRVASVTANGVALNPIEGNEKPVVMTHADFEHRALTLTPRLKESLNARQSTTAPDKGASAAGEKDALEALREEAAQSRAAEGIIDIAPKARTKARPHALVEVEVPNSFGGTKKVLQVHDVNGDAVTRDNGSGRHFPATFNARDGNDRRRAEKFLGQAQSSFDRKANRKSFDEFDDDDTDDTPEEETISGANYQFEMGRYVTAQLAKSGLTASGLY